MSNSIKKTTNLPPLSGKKKDDIKNYKKNLSNNKKDDNSSQSSNSLTSISSSSFPVRLSSKYKEILTPTHSWPLFDAYVSSLPSQLAFQEHTISSAFVKPVSYIEYNKKYGEYQVIKGEGSGPLTNIIYNNTPTTLNNNNQYYQQQVIQQNQHQRSKYLSTSYELIKEYDKKKYYQMNPPISIPTVIYLLLEIQDKVTGNFPPVEKLLEILGIPNALEFDPQIIIEYKQNLGTGVALAIYKQHIDLFDLLYDSFSLAEKWLPPKNIMLNIQQQLINLFLMPSKYEERIAYLNSKMSDHISPEQSQEYFDIEDSNSLNSENDGAFQFQFTKDLLPQTESSNLNNTNVDAQSVGSLSTMESPSVLALPHMDKTYNNGPRDLQYLYEDNDDLHILFADKLKEIQELANKEQKELQIKSLKLQTNQSTNNFDNPENIETTTYHLLSPIPGSPINYAETPVTKPNEKSKLQSSNSFSLLNSTLNDLTAYDVDLIELEKQKKLIEFHETEVVRLIMSIEEEIPKVSDALTQCVARYNNSDLLTEKYKQFDMLMYSVSDGFAPESTFDDWRKYGVKSIRNLIIKFLNALHHLSFARHRLNVLDPQNKYHQSSYQEKEEEEDDEDLDQLKYTNVGQSSSMKVSLDTTLILKGEIDKVKKKQFKRIKDNWTVLWSGKNSASKISHCMDFLRKSRELSEWWGLAFYFVSNPLFFPFPMTEAFEISRMSEYVDALLTYMSQGGTTMTTEEILDNFHENYDEENDNQYEPWRIADPHSYAHAHFFSEWKRKFMNKFKDCASNWPKPPDIRDNEIALSIFNCIVVLYITCESSIVRSFKWERQFIAEISSTRGQEKYLVGLGNPKRDKLLEITPTELRTNYRPPVHGLSNKRFNNNRKNSVSSSGRRKSVDQKSVDNSVNNNSDEDDEFDHEPPPSEQLNEDIPEEDENSVEEIKPVPDQKVSKEKVKKFANILKSSGGIITSRRGGKPLPQKEEQAPPEPQGRLTKMSVQRASVLTRNAINNLKNIPKTFLLNKIIDDEDSVESDSELEKKDDNNEELKDQKDENKKVDKKEEKQSPKKRDNSILLKSNSQPQLGSPNKRGSILRPLSSELGRKSTFSRGSILSTTNTLENKKSTIISPTKQRKSILSPIKEPKKSEGQRKSIVPPPPSVLKMGDSSDIGKTSLSVLNTHIEEDEEEEDDEEEAALIASRKEKFRLQQLKNLNPLVNSVRNRPNSKEKSKESRNSILSTSLTKRNTTIKKN